MLLLGFLIYNTCRIQFRVFFFQAEDGIRDLVRSRGLGDVYKRQPFLSAQNCRPFRMDLSKYNYIKQSLHKQLTRYKNCLLYTSDAADERSSVDLGGRRIIKKKSKDTKIKTHMTQI